MRMRTVLAPVLLASQLFMTGCDKDASQDATPTNPVISGSDADAAGEAPSGTEAGRRSGMGKIGVQLTLNRDFDSSMGMNSGGEKYGMEIQVGNPNENVFEFDTIDMEFTDGVNQKLGKGMFGESGQTLISTKKGNCTVYHYGGAKNEGMPVHEPGDETDVVALPSHRAVSMRSGMTAMLMPTITGRSFTIMNASLCLNGRRLREVYRIVLPPLMKLEYQMKLHSGYKLRMWPERNIPGPSGAFVESTLEKAFQKAFSVASDAVLVGIFPEALTVNSYSAGGIMNVPAVWHYQFWSSGRSFWVSVLDPSAVKDVKHEKLIVPLDREMLKKCIVDVDTVTMMLEEAHAIADKEGYHCSLVAMIIDGKPRPVWDIGYRIGGEKASVMADTGTIVHIEGEAAKEFEVIWN